MSPNALLRNILLRRLQILAIMHFTAAAILAASCASLSSSQFKRTSKLISRFADFQTHATLALFAPRIVSTIASSSRAIEHSQ
jgi:hypothetical protein